MERTTSTLVAGIIEVDVEIPLDPFILTASVLVDRIATVDDTVPDPLLELIERWLSAHFYTVRDPRREQETAGPVSERFQSKVDLFLKTSHYGQMAIALDPTGTLAAIGAAAEAGEVAAGGVAVGLHWLGTEDA